MTNYIKGFRYTNLTNGFLYDIVLTYNLINKTFPLKKGFFLYRTFFCNKPERFGRYYLFCT